MPHQAARTDLLIAVLCATQRKDNPLPGGDPRRWNRITRTLNRTRIDIRDCRDLAGCLATAPGTPLSAIANTGALPVRSPR